MMTYRFHPNYEETVRLRDGTRVLLRPIRPTDKALLREGFERLSPESRYTRFLAPKASLTDEELRYLTEVDGIDHFALVALHRPAIGTEEGIGIGRFVRIAEQSETAEPAITVADDHQGQGLGTILLHRLLEAAWERGIREFRCQVLVENTRLRELLDEIDVDIRVEEMSGGALVVTFPVGPPPPEPALRPSLRRLFAQVAKELITVAPVRRIAHWTSPFLRKGDEPMTEQDTKQGSVKGNVETELKALRTDLKRIAQDIRSKIDQAGQDAKQTWKRLDAERERFIKQVEQAADETSADLRKMGSDLKRRLQSLREEIQPPEGPKES